MVGSSLGPYKILEPLGAGGMGEVYLGEDTRLGRKVAIKVLPAEFASDPERLARFEQEARAAAALNHPHIAVVHDIGTDANEDGGDTHFMVQEYLQGQSLRERLDKAALPLDKALDLAIEVGEALIAAHKAGIIHRDLKPDNIFLTEEGHAKVLDFGLAKLTEMAPPPASSASMSPTMLGTLAGQVMGTAGYMAPEQVNGEEVDQRADLFAFGAVLYEMVTGHRAFSGESIVQTLSQIAHEEPEPLSQGLAMPPAELERIARKCLAKPPGRRYQDADDLTVDLRQLRDDLTAGVAVAVGDGPSVDAAVVETTTGISWKLGIAVAVALVGVTASLMWIATRPASPSPVRVHLDVGKDIAPSLGSSLALSPDGEHIAYVALSTAAERELMIRSLDQRESTSLVAETEMTAALDQPFFSPDGQWVGFTTDRGLKKVPVTGGTPVSITEGRRGRGADWGPGDVIVYTPDDTSGLFLVSANGGEPEPLTELAEEETTHRWPHFLPGGNAVLFTSHVSGDDDNFDAATIEVLDLDSGQRTVVQRNGSAGRYVPTGHLVYVNGGTLFARPFDVNAPATGSAIPVVEDVSTLLISGGAEFAFSAAGMLVYREGISEARDTARPVWVDRDGAVEDIATLPAGATTPRLSPDGQSVLVEFENDLWIYELATGRRRRITRDGASRRGEWNRMNSSLAYSSGRFGYEQAWVEPSDGSGERRRLTDFDGGLVHVDSWSPDGRTLALHRHAEDGINLLLVAVEEANAEPESIFEDGTPRADSVFSPDGSYLAYMSGETRGRREVYIRPYPGPGAEQPVSVGGGQQPVWAPNGELFYRDSSGERMMVVSVTTEPSLTIGAQRQLFQGSYVNNTAEGWGRPQYDVTPDGQRFLMLLPEADSELEEGDAPPERPQINVVLNWFEELKERVPPGR